MKSKYVYDEDNLGYLSTVKKKKNDRTPLGPRVKF